MVLGESQGGRGDEDGADASKQDVRAIGVQGEIQLAPKVAKPKDSNSGPGFGHLVDEHGGQQHQKEEPTHSLHRVYRDVFDIQTALLVEAVEMLNLGTAAPASAEARQKTLPNP